MAFTVPVVFAGAVAYKVVDALNAKLEPAAGEDSSNEPESWTDALANSFYLLNNVPGADATTDEWDTPGGARRGFVTQCIVFVGLFVFAIIIGIISDEITAQVEDVKTGNNKVVGPVHRVVNWNSQLVPLLKQGGGGWNARGRSTDRNALADVDKETMDEAIGEALEESPLQVVTGGNPFDAEDLGPSTPSPPSVIISPARGRGRAWAKASTPGTRATRARAHQGAPVSARAARGGAQGDGHLEPAQRQGAANPDVVVQMPYRLPNEQDL